MAIAANPLDGHPRSRLIFLAYCNIGKTWRIIRHVNWLVKNGAGRRDSALCGFW